MLVYHSSVVFFFVQGGMLLQDVLLIHDAYNMLNFTPQLWCEFSKGIIP